MSSSAGRQPRRILVIGGSAEAGFASRLQNGLAAYGVDVDSSIGVGASFKDLGAFAKSYDLIFFRIYFRPPSHPTKSQIEDFFQRSEWMNLALGLTAVVEPGRFFNHPIAGLIAESKPLQLETARSVGMAVPETLFSNELSMIREFAASRRVIVKPVDTSLLAHPDRPDDTLLMFTRELTVDDTAADDLVATSDSPMIVQTLIEKKHELRVIVFGTDVQTIHIDSQAHPHSRIDFRRRLMDMKMYSVGVSDPILDEQCVAYCRKLGLDSGVFDFAVGTDGVTYFLECNPNGQWESMNAAAGAGVDAAAFAYFRERLGVSDPSSSAAASASDQERAPLQTGGC